MTADKRSQNKQPQQREPISLAPLGFEEALSDLLKTGPHPNEGDAKEGTIKPLPHKKQRRGNKPTGTD